VQQTCFPFEIIVDIACLKNNGNPTTEVIAKQFNKMGLDVRLTYIDDIELFAHRGMVRNIQIKNANKLKCDYIYFGDADHVYHPKMFSRLTKWIDENGKNCHSVIFSRSKVHTEQKLTKKEIDKSINEMPYIHNAYVRSCELPVIEHTDKNRLAPGNMQIVAMRDVNENGGIYVDPKKCLDKNLFKKGQRARSDIQFRGRIGSSTAIRLPMQIHLNHLRDKEARKHLEIQR
jgi:hypothetical protein